MPRKARIDAPGALHHVIVRGIERRKIFLDDANRDRFVERLSVVIDETQTACFAWALIPNHFHLLLRTGNEGVSRDSDVDILSTSEKSSGYMGTYIKL